MSLIGRCGRLSGPLGSLRQGASGLERERDEAKDAASAGRPAYDPLEDAFPRKRVAHGRTRRLATRLGATARCADRQRSRVVVCLRWYMIKAQIAYVLERMGMTQEVDPATGLIEIASGGGAVTLRYVGVPTVSEEARHEVRKAIERFLADCQTMIVWYAAIERFSRQHTSTS